MNGNLVQTPELKLTYDALDRLISVQRGSESISYSYDPWNRRMSKSTGELYLYAMQNEIGSYVGDECKSLRLLGVGRGAEIGASVAIELDGIAYAPVHDIAGNVVCLINKETYRYTAYGKQVEGGCLNNPWRFASKRYDLETGFVNFGRRYYSPEMMKWITPDPVGYEDGPNLYAYVHNNPLTHFDEYGLLDSRIHNGTAASSASGMWDNFKAGLGHQLHEETFGFAGTNSDEDTRDVGGVSYYAGRGTMFVGSLFVPLGWATKSIKALKYGGKAVSVAGRYLSKVTKVTGNLSKKSSKNIKKMNVAKVLRQRFSPDLEAHGAHSVFRKNSVTGKTEKYQTYWKQSNIKNPNAWENGVRYDGISHQHQHFNKVTRERVCTPHIHDSKTPGGIRAPLEWEIP